MEEKINKLEKDLHIVIENFSFNRYEMIRKLNSLTQSFCKRNNIMCLTSMNNNIIHFSFTITEHNIHHIYVDINLILRKNKIKKLKGM
jgi:hypothetical protein